MDIVRGSAHSVCCSWESRPFWLHSFGSPHEAVLPSHRDRGRKQSQANNSTFVLRTLRSSQLHSFAEHADRVWSKFSLGRHLEEALLGWIIQGMENSNWWADRLGPALGLACLGIKHKRQMESYPPSSPLAFPFSKERLQPKGNGEASFPPDLSFCLCWGRKTSLPIHLLFPHPSDWSSPLALCGFHLTNVNEMAL